MRPTFMKALFSKLLLSLLFIMPMHAQPVNPQPGENIWHLTAAIGTELDVYSFSIISKIDFISTASCDFLEIISQGSTTQSKLDLCCSTLNSKVDLLTDIVVADFAGTFTSIAAIEATNLNGTYTVLNTILSQEVTTQSKLDVCCTSLGSQLNSIEMQLEAFTGSNIDALIGTYTTLISLSDVLVSVVEQIDQTAMHLSDTLAQLESLLDNVIAVEVTTQSKLDLCCATLNSKVDLLTNITVADFAGTFTAIAAIPATNLSGTYTLLNTAIAQEYTTQSKVDALTTIVNADFAGTFTAIAAIPTESCDLAGTYTVLNTILGQEITTQSKIDLCCATINSGITNLIDLNTANFLCCEAVGSGVDSLITQVTADFAGTFTAIAAISSSACDISGTYTVLNSILVTEVVTQSKIDLCCSTLNSKIDAINCSATVDFTGTYTLLNTAIAQEYTTQSKVDALTNIVNADFAGTFTAIAAISASTCDISGTYTVLNSILVTEVTTQSKIDLCCSTLNSKIDSLTHIVVADFAGTFTAIAAIPAASLSGTYTVLNTILSQEITTQSKIDLCCSTLNSKIDALTNILKTDFAGTFTAIAAISATNLSGTYTVLNALLNEEATTQSKLDLCCSTLNSKVDSLTNVAIQDFNGTFTTLNQLSLCSPIPFAPTGTTTITTPGVYCLTGDADISGTITINSNDVTIDLNGHMISGGGSGAIIIGSAVTANITIRNGIISSSGACVENSSVNLSNLIVRDLELDSTMGAEAFVSITSTSTLTNSVFENVRCFSNFGFDIEQICSNITFNKCTVDCPLGSSESFCFLVRNTEPVEGENIGIFFKDCIVNNSVNYSWYVYNVQAVFENCQSNYSSGNDFNVNLIATSGQIIFKNCSALGAFNTTITSTGFNVVAGSANQSAYFENCIAEGRYNGFNATTNSQFFNCVANNTVGGFTTTNCTMNNCIASQCTQFGFEINHSGILTNCTASQCTSYGFELPAIGNASYCIANTCGTGFLASGNYAVGNCTASQCTTGFRDSGGTAILYSNTATGCTNSYTSVISPPSAPRFQFASATPFANTYDVNP